MTEESISRCFLVSWCSEGLEAVMDITDLEQRAMIDILKTGRPKININHYVQMMMMRARANPQRHYEIYTFNATYEITSADIDDYFKSNPQMAADRIREIGTKIFSDRATEKKVVIV
jgi:hypothetical protein